MRSARALALHGGIALLVASLPTPSAHAQDHGAEAYAAWTSAFLVKKDLGSHKGMTFFAKALTGSDHNVPDDNWRLAIDIMIVEDRYERTRDPAQLVLIDTLLGDYITFNGTDYSGDAWNDDLGWISIAFIRGYQLTGKQKYLDLSARVWNLAYDRGWDASLGGGIWENKLERPGKEALSNNPFVLSGLALHAATSDETYLRKSVAIYDWVRKYLFDTNTGQVNQGFDPPGTLNPGGNVYNSGTFILAANGLYGVLGSVGYLEDAQKAIDYVIAKGPILRNSDNTQNSLWAYWFVKGLTEYCADHQKWDTYGDYLDANAQSSWAHRDPKTNLTGNDWTKVYSYPDATKVGPMPSNSGVAIWALNDRTRGATPDDAGVDAGASGDGGAAGDGAWLGASDGRASDGGAPNGAGSGPSDGGAYVAPWAGDGAVPVPAPADAGDPPPKRGAGCAVGAGEDPTRDLSLASVLGLALLVARRRRRDR